MSKSGKLRWKLGEAATGLAAVGARHRGYILHDGEAEFARIYPNGGGWSSSQNGWYWVARVGESYVNTCSAPVSEIDTAKRDARAWVDKVLKDQTQ